MTDQTASTLDTADSQKILNEFLNLLNQGVTIYTMFVKNEDEVMTHQVLVIQCGNNFVRSVPIPLATQVVEAPKQTQTTICYN